MAVLNAPFSQVGSNAGLCVTPASPQNSFSSGTNVIDLTVTTNQPIGTLITAGTNLIDVPIGATYLQLLIESNGLAVTANPVLVLNGVDQNSRSIVLCNVPGSTAATFAGALLLKTNTSASTVSEFVPSTAKLFTWDLLDSASAQLFVGTAASVSGYTGTMTVTGYFRFL